jgi:hypothetical protein
MMLVAVLLLMRMHPLLLLDVVMGVVMVPVVPLAMLSGGSSPTSATPRRRPMCAFVALRSRPIFLLHHLFMSFRIHISSMMLAMGLPMAMSRDLAMMRALLVRRILAPRVVIVFLLMIVHLIFLLVTLLRIQ